MGEMVSQAADGKTWPRLLATPKADRARRLCLYQEWWGSRSNQEDCGPARRSWLPRPCPDLYRARSAKAADEASHLMSNSTFPMPPSKTFAAPCSS